MIKFQHHYVQNGTKKTKVTYSISNRLDGRACVTIYAKGYDRKNFRDVFGDLARNDSDIMTDYFEGSRATIFSDNPLYSEALKRAEIVAKKNQERWSKRK